MPKRTEPRGMNRFAPAPRCSSIDRALAVVHNMLQTGRIVLMSHGGARLHHCKPGFCFWQSEGRPNTYGHTVSKAANGVYRSQSCAVIVG